MKSYLRFLSRNKLYTAIEVVGFSLALAFVVPMINLFTDKSERSHSHYRYEDIYAVAYMGNLWTDINFGEFVQERIPEVERISSAIINPVRTLIDKDFFYFFPFEFIEGNESFLDSRENIAVSEKYADIIADGSAIGKIVKIEGKEYTVAAVYKNHRNDILKECDILQSIAEMKELSLSGGISNGQTFVSFSQGHNRKAMEVRILEIADEFKKGDETYNQIKESGAFRGLIRYDELPENIVNYGHFMKWESISMTFVAILLGLILLVAILNYINLNIALSTTRARENATRKLVGASRIQIIAKSLVESFAFTAICFILGYLLSSHSSSFIKGLLAMTEFTDFSVEPIWNFKTITASVVIILITSVAAGLSPALIGSRFSPLDVTKGNFRLHSKRSLSRFFISFQTILSVVLLSVVLMMYKCYKGTMEIDFNCDIEDVVFVRTSPENAAIMVAKASENPEIISAGLASQVPAEGLSGVFSTANEPQYIFSHIKCDLGGFQTFGFEILQQYEEDFQGLWLTPYTQSYIQRDSLILDNLYKLSDSDRIAGIINDFPGTAPLNNSRITLTFASVKDGGRVSGAVFKTTSDHKRGYEIIESIHNESIADEVIDEASIRVTPRYVPEIVKEVTSHFKMVIEMIGLVMILVVFMSMMGLTGMSIHFTNERRNEIAVRKIFGATENAELLRNLRFYLIISGVASVIGICVAELTRILFGQFGIQVRNVWWVYIVSICLSFAISLISVFWQTLLAARTNPAETLKKE